jgi:apolipoprotein N-acyltransferase
MDVERSGQGTGLIWGIHLSRESPARRRIVWGLFLMGLGTVLLLMQLGVLQIPGLWRFWPAVFGVAAVSQLMERKPGSAAMSVLMGVAFFAAQFGWLGLSYRSFWPLLVVAVGVGIVLAAISGEDRHGAR